MPYYIEIYLLARLVSSKDESFLSGVLINGPLAGVDPSIWGLSSLESKSRKQDGLCIQNFDRLSGGLIVLTDDSSPW